VILSVLVSLWHKKITFVPAHRSALAHRCVSLDLCGYFATKVALKTIRSKKVLKNLFIYTLNLYLLLNKTNENL